MLLILQEQFLYSRSVELIVEEKEKFENGMADDSNSQVCLNIILSQAVKKCGNDELKFT